MKNVICLSSLGVVVSLALSGCAGELDPNEFPNAGTGSLQTTSTPTTTSTTTATGSGGAGGSGGGAPVDMCVINSMKSCKAEGCHGVTPAANLVLTPETTTVNFKGLFVNKPNGGTAGITMPGDPAGCQTGQYKLIDAANPEMSLIYVKSLTTGNTPPCGSKMPVIGAFTAADKTCILNWINSVIAADK